MLWEIVIVIVMAVFLSSLTFCDTFGSFPTVHRELAHRGKGGTEKTRGRGHDNQTEQEEAQAHPTAAHVPTA